MDALTLAGTADFSNLRRNPDEIIKLVIKNCKVKNFEHIQKLPNLKILKFSKFDLANISHHLKHLSNLEELYINISNIGRLDVITKLTNLRILYIYHPGKCSFALPTDMHTMINLEEITIISTQMNELPESITLLPKLKKIILDGLGTAVMASRPIQKGETIMDVIVSFQFKFPSDMTKLVNLKVLKVTNYNITETPKFIENMRLQICEFS